MVYFLWFLIGLGVVLAVSMPSFSAVSKKDDESQNWSVEAMGIAFKRLEKQVFALELEFKRAIHDDVSISADSFQKSDIVLLREEVQRLLVLGNENRELFQKTLDVLSEIRQNENKRQEGILPLQLQEKFGYVEKQLNDIKSILSKIDSTTFTRR